MSNGSWGRLSPGIPAFAVCCLLFDLFFGLFKGHKKEYRLNGG